MNNFREKAPVFLLGLMFGVLIAGSFFILKLDDYIKDLGVYKSISGTFRSDEKTPEVSVADPVRPKPRSSKKRVSSKDSVIRSAGLGSVTQRDTVMRSDSVAGTAEEEIVVKKDEMLSAITLDVTNIGSSGKKDSLLSKVSGVRDDKNTRQMLHVEFWASPLNYKGYKLSKYKLVLYGMSYTENMKLYKLDDVIYLKQNGYVYRLDYVSDFRAYERITDEVVLNRLK